MGLQQHVQRPGFCWKPLGNRAAAVSAVWFRDSTSGGAPELHTADAFPATCGRGAHTAVFETLTGVF